MKTKDEILKKAMGKPHLRETYYDYLDDAEKPLIYKAMTEFADQEKKLFAEKILKEFSKFNQETKFDSGTISSILNRVFKNNNINL